MVMTTMSDTNLTNEGVIAYLRTLSAVDPEELSQNGLQINSFLEGTPSSSNDESDSANGVLRGDPGPVIVPPRYEYPLNKEQNEVPVPQHERDGKAENSTIVEPPVTMEAKRREAEKHALDEEQKALPNALIQQGKRPSGPDLRLHSTHRRSEEEEMLGLLMDKARLRGQLAQLREEMRRIQSWLEKVMQESRMKDVKIMQLEIQIMEAAMEFEGEKPCNDPAPLKVAVENPVIVHPSSLVQFAMKQ